MGIVPYGDWRTVAVAVALVSGPAGLAAQEPLTLVRVCAFDSDALTEPAYVFDAQREVEARVDSMVRLSARPQNFALRAANVAEAVSGLSDGRRYVLYNQFSLANLERSREGKWVLLGILAHQVGHQILEHSFATDPDTRHAEELAAEAEAGRILRSFGATLAEARLALTRRNESTPHPRYPSAADRIAALSAGWTGAAGDGAQFTSSSDNSVPTFQWPPPRASARFDLPASLLPGDARLTDIAAILEQALGEAGFPDKSYYAVPGGFALVAQLERINDEGQPQPGGGRWDAELRPPKVMTVRSYFEALFLPRPGRYRLVVFLVTSQAFAYKSESVSFEVSRDWLWAGSNRLPPSVGIERYSADHYTTALIYEFHQPGVQQPAALRIPSALSGRLHLERAGIWARLRR